jgi:ATP-dependent RNA helicase DeaD
MMSDVQPPESPPAEAERPQEYVAEIGFDDLGLSPPIRRAVAERGYTHPTPVQAKAFKPVHEGRDLICRSKTGTGKTAAFGLPLLERINPEDRVVRALVLCPTRELALQVAAEIGELGKYRGVKVAAIYGGTSMKTQEDALESGTQFIVGTPGRVYDHIRRKNLKLDQCRHVVLDEADEMLNQGFYEEVTRILDCLPADRQVLLFSATVPPDIQNLISKYTRDPEKLLMSGDVLTVDHIHHVRYDVSDAFPKPRNLIYLLEMEEPDNAIIFCNTRDDTSLVTAVLNRNGFDAELINGDLPQKERERVMAKVKRGEVAFMVATDIAARGIDISDLGYVINYSLPEDPAVYLHRVGRTGRIGKKGVALNLVSGREIATLSALEKQYKIPFEKKPMPSPEEALRLWTERHVREIKTTSAGGVYEAFLPLAGSLKQRPDADDLIAFLLRYFFSRHRMEKAQAAQRAEEKPAPRREEREKDRGRERERGERRERGGRERERDRERRSERPAREAKEPKEAREPAPMLEPGQVRVWVNLGKNDGLEAAGVVAALEAAGAPAGKVANTELRGTYSYVFVGEADAAAFEAASGKPHGQKTLKVERARPRPAR